MRGGGGGGGRLAPLQPGLWLPDFWQYCWCGPVLFIDLALFIATLCRSWTMDLPAYNRLARHSVHRRTCQPLLTRDRLIAGCRELWERLELRGLRKSRGGSAVALRAARGGLLLRVLRCDTAGGGATAAAGGASQRFPGGGVAAAGSNDSNRNTDATA